ncbi:hypothetical protein N5P37_003368 [Trichoderma harzianum]|uniref:SSCRP protein n=1 Tax=Trichoderma harzianum CBS 226.95 TaxID=983964 RepID=A0A2T4AU87_TRIHA|nr:hypothetical protein M431DRAFT_12505 [Trichoderma harzianum CBS 226.95]KAK0763975.1 hypothetical protein N5P37_003368 [Trichoderma harzianum]PKK45761.1 hypothetical protein CI102_10196 [Trichoderma harzianum]PTB60611.1 hypothetical protein M431DRAFT_12505 [Trichoderma harzianum CBS 226.95]
MQFSSVLSLVFAGIVAAQDVATLFSATNFEGVSYTISGTDDSLGGCNPVATFPLVQSIKVAEGHAVVLYNTADCEIPYAAYDRDTAATIVNGNFAAFSVAVATGHQIGGSA